MKDEIRKLGKDFSASELLPEWENLDAGSPALLAAVLKKAACDGVFSFLVPEQCGGAGLTVSDYCVFLEEIARGCPGGAAALAFHAQALAPLIMLDGCAASQSILSRIPEYEKREMPMLFAPAVNEESSRGIFGDDINTVFEIEQGQAAVTGVKKNVPCAETASVFTVAAKSKTDGELAIIFVPSGSGGIEIKKEKQRIGLRFCPMNDVVFNDVLIPVENIINVDENKKMMREWVEYADPALASVAIGIAAQAHDVAIKYSIQRYQGGKMICDHDVVRLLLSEMEMRLQSSRALAYGPEAGFLSSAFAADAAEAVCLDAVQVLGGYGYMQDYRVERFLRDAKALRAIINPRARKMHHTGIEIEKLK